MRPNRQPEFTQLDLEASFVNQHDIMTITENAINAAFSANNVDFNGEFQHITYEDALNTYGTDALDLRYGMTFADATNIFKDCGYKIFNSIVSGGGAIKGFAIPNMASELSKNMIQNELASKAIQSCGGKGLTWMKVLENDEFESNIVQFFSKEELIAAREATQATPNDIMVFVADASLHTVNTVLGRFRTLVAERFNLIPTNKYAACWITEFPLFERLDDGSFTSLHHPFTKPIEPIHDQMSDDEILALRADAYDVVINGQEVGGGSIRIHDSAQQEAVFKCLRLTDDEIDQKFGFCRRP